MGMSQLLVVVVEGKADLMMMYEGDEE